MGGDGDALAKIVSNPKGPAADLVRDVAEAFGAIAGQDWPRAERLLICCMADDAHMGGSRAQRDLLEFSLLECLLKQGKAAEARRLSAQRLQLVAHRFRHRVITVEPAGPVRIDLRCRALASSIRCSPK